MMPSNAASRRRFLLLSGASVLASCGPRGGLTFVAERPTGGGTVQDILVATTRRRVDGQPVFDKVRVDPPTFAAFEVWVPPQRELRELDRDIAETSLEDEPTNRLLTITGVNLAVAAGLMAAIGDIARFDSPQ